MGAPVEERVKIWFRQATQTGTKAWHSRKDGSKYMRDISSFQRRKGRQGVWTYDLEDWVGH